MKLQFSKVAAFFKSLGKHEEKDGVNYGTAYDVVTPKGKINRHRRRETAQSAARVGCGTKRLPPTNYKRKKRARRKNSANHGKRPNS